MSINKVIIVGRLGRDPELKYTPSGMAVCTFSVATSERWKDKDGKDQERTEWHRIVVWSKLAELCNQYLSQGKQVFIEGQLQTRSWDDKEGQKRYVTEIIAKSVQFLGDRPESGEAKSYRDQYSDSEKTFNADDIPF